MGRITKYIISLYIISFLLQIIVLTNGGFESKLFNILTPIIMYMPALLVIVHTIVTKEGLKSINWKIGKPIYLLYGIFFPAFLSILMMGIINSLGYGESAHMALVDGKVNILKGRFTLGNGLQSYGFFFLNMLVTAVFFSIISGLFAFGEELGWRGFLQKKLLIEVGLLKGIIILGLVWGFWHFPYIASGYNYPESPYLGAFVIFPLMTVFASFFLAWLTIKAQSFWPAVLAHGSVNAFMGSFVQGMEFGEHRLTADLIVLSIWLIVGFFSYLLLRKEYPNNVSSL